MINRTLVIKYFQDRFSEENWGLITGKTDNNVVVHYTGQTTSDAYLTKIPLLLTKNIDDIGYFNGIVDIWEPFTDYSVGEYVFYNGNSYICKANHYSSNTGFEYYQSIHWTITPSGETGSTVTFVGNPRIDEFRRFGKTENDIDLYNPIWNTGYTQDILTPDGLIKQITGERQRTNPNNKQNLFDYLFKISGENDTIITYSDNEDFTSNISYKSLGVSNKNSIEVPKIKLDYLLGVINEPKIDVDVFIDRGSNSAFERHLKLGDIKSLDDLENYGGGFFKIIES